MEVMWTSRGTGRPNVGTLETSQLTRSLRLWRNCRMKAPRPSLGAKKCGQNTPTRSYYSKSRHFCGDIAKKSAKNRAGGAKLPPRYFGKPACCTMVPNHQDTLKTPTLPYVHTPLPPNFWPNMCMHVMGGCQAGKAQRKSEHGPGNCPGPLLFLKFSIILGQINKHHF